MNWGSLDKGSNINLVRRMLIFDFEHDRHVLEVIPSKQTFYLSGLLDAGYESYTLFDATLASQFPVPSVALNPSSNVLGHKDVTWDSLMSVIDMCCGFGGFTQGILPCGFHTSVAVDHNDKMIKLFSTVSNVPMVLGDVGDKHTICQVWKESQGSRTMTAGFSCQPFSSLGDRRSSEDARSSCLTKLLHAAFYLRVHILVLECVAPAAMDSFVKAELEHFCTVTGFSCTQRTMQLDQVWPCRRSRSWWLLTSPVIGTIQIPEFTCQHAVPTIEHLIPLVQPWDKNDEDALKLLEIERRAFGGLEGDFSRYVMNAKGIAPCALHAWGNQLIACPCGCRNYGLSAHRLAERGLFGLLVQCAPDLNGDSHIRHIHPCEAMALNGMDPSLDYGLDPRLTLSAVGQIASPLQVLWVMAAISNHIDVLRFGKSEFSAETQLHAYMAWLVMKCSLVWPQKTEAVFLEKFDPLIPCWQSVEHLSLEELMFPQRWDNKFEGPVTIGAILDFLFRDHQNSAKPVKPISLPVDEDCCMLEPETPWIDCPDQTKTDDGEPCLDAEFCTVFFDGDIQAPVKLNPIVGSTLQELLSAHEKLVGTCHVQQCVDANGQTLPLTHRLAVGELIFVKFIHPAMSALPPSVKEVDASLPATSLDPEITQTAPWTHPPDETSRKPSVFDIGECSVALIKDQPAWLNAEPLLGLQGEQFQFLSTPQISNPQQLWSVRNQFLKVQDRLAILANQGKISSDDELRFHLFALSQKYVETQVLFSKDPVKQLVTIDPLIATAWLHGKAFSCEAWGHDHGFIHAQSLPVATAFKLGNHWIPVSMYPVGDALHVFLWDADGNDHTKLNEVLEELGLAMGFVSVCIQRDRRMFFTSDLCGTLAVAYLHNVFLHVQLPANSEETLQRFHFYRGEFVKSFSHCDIARRPWVWAQGDQNQTSDPQVSLSDTVQLPVTLTREQRLDLISTHGKAVADDEIRFHILHIIDRYHAICAENNQQPAHHYLFFEPLVFTCWESIGRTISARWCERNPEVRTQGKQILTAFLLDNHWFPFWISPNGDCIQFHTIAHEVVDAQKFRDVCACIGQQLGFPLFTLHISPSPLPEHDLCGAFSMMFLAHIVHGARLPDTVETLTTLHANMRATFVADLYTKTEVPEPVIWGNGMFSRESGPLPIMPCMQCHDQPAQCDAQSLIAETFCLPQSVSQPLMVQEFDWYTVHKLVQWQIGSSFSMSQLPDLPCQATDLGAHQYTRAVDVAEMEFHLARLRAAMVPTQECSNRPIILVLQGTTEIQNSLVQFAAGQEDVMLMVALEDHHWFPLCVSALPK